VRELVSWRIVEVLRECKRERCKTVMRRIEEFVNMICVVGVGVGVGAVVEKICCENFDVY